MSAFPILDTAISLLPVGLGLAAFIHDGKIDPRSRFGTWYLITMLAGTVSAFGFIATLGFTPGQVLTLLTLALLAVGTLTLKGQWRSPGHVQNIALTTTFLLLMVFTTAEILKKFPLGHPFASGADDPSLMPIRFALLVLYVLTIGFQVRKVEAERRAEDFQRTLSILRHAA